MNTKATIKRIKHPTKTGEITYQYPIFFNSTEPVTAIKAVAPPGGCKVLVICIKTIDNETAKGAAIHKISGMSFWMLTPIIAETT